MDVEKKQINEAGKIVEIYKDGVFQFISKEGNKLKPAADTKKIEQTFEKRLQALSKVSPKEIREVSEK